MTTAANAATRIAGRWQPAVAVGVRVLLAVLGGYAFTAAAVMLGGWALAASGLFSRSDAVVLAALLGFLLYLGLLLWAFAERRLARLALVLAGGSALLHAGAWLLRY
ncbi:MAG: iron uptake protein [Gammaproteobacteria bacterium]|uniref:iron uptake protein n=1 Tax=Nevskia sp. TaxID=1929292 RepID=UPI0040350503|nr:iron uptake protein [Gammaproteobacteria bacterium]